MKILRFEADHLHGYLSFVLNLQPQLTFLTGINGAGKTSALRSMMSLLLPSLRSLSETEFGRISVTVLSDEHERTISARRSANDLVLSCTGIGETLSIPILKRDRFEGPLRFSTRQRDFFREMEIRATQNPTFRAINGLPTPMYLDLERREEDWIPSRRDGTGLGPRTQSANRLGGGKSDSLSIAESLAEKAFNQYMAWRTERTDRLKQDIILAAFRPAAESRYDSFLPSPNVQREILDEIQKNERELPSSLLEIGIPGDRVHEIVLPFFKHARDAVSNAPREDQFDGDIHEEIVKRLQDWSAVQPQIRQIDQLVALIDQYNADVSGRFAPFAAYQKSVNQFLAESGKQIDFDPRGNLTVKIDKSGDSRTISALSSGERQLMVILTHLSFNQAVTLANVLIIDEPELSLHLHWQELFVDAARGASPGIQLILATHSPAIIGTKLGHCIDVMEAQHVDSLFG